MLQDDLRGAILPIWIAAIPTSVSVPEQRTFPVAQKFTSMCRLQRQTDEKGLSAWSSGYGASGNPTKSQLRLQKKLAIVLGLLHSMQSGYEVIIFDDQKTEIVMLHKQIELWVKHCPVKFGTKKWKFVISSSDSRIAGSMVGHTTTQTHWTGQFHLVYFPSISLEIPSESEWSKIEAAQISSLQILLGHNYAPETRGDIYVHVYTHVFCTQVFDMFSVTTLGSAHNLMGVVSSLARFPYASSDGTSPWQFECKESASVSAREFVSRVMMHNAARSAFFLNGRYYFNPVLNLLRNLEGKTMNFITGEVSDIVGIEVQYDSQQRSLLTDFDPDESEEYSGSDESEEEDEPPDNSSQSFVYSERSDRFELQNAHTSSLPPENPPQSTTETSTETKTVVPLAQPAKEEQKEEIEVACVPLDASFDQFG